MVLKTPECLIGSPELNTCQAELVIYAPAPNLCHFSKCYLKTGFTSWWVIEPVSTTKLKIRRRKDLLLAASKENTGGLSQSSVSPK